MKSRFFVLLHRFSLCFKAISTAPVIMRVSVIDCVVVGVRDFHGFLFCFRKISFLLA